MTAIDSARATASTSIGTQRGEAASVHPGGTPSVTDSSAAVEVEVVSAPDASVMMNVCSVGEGIIVGNAVRLVVAVAKMGL